MKNLKLIAVGDCNHDYYIDENECVYYIHKPGSSCNDGIYCGANKLHDHFWHLRQLSWRGFRRGYDSLIPPDWKIVDYNFFKKWRCV